MAEEQTIGKLRYRAGLAVFAFSFLSPLLIPLVAISGLPISIKTMVSGLLAIGISEIGMIAAVAILGKPGYREIRQRIGRFAGAHGRPDNVSRLRYRFGLVMFVIPLAFAVAQPCAEFVLAETAVHSIWMTTRLSAAAIGDVMFLASFVVLGGNFWNKIRSLFVYRATALIPQKDAESSS